MKNTIVNLDGKCGSCEYLCINPNKKQIKEANTEANRLKGRDWKAGVCTKLGLWCSLSSKRCGGSDYSKKN
jgi:hypothetical protein